MKSKTPLRIFLRVVNRTFTRLRANHDGCTGQNPSVEAFDRPLNRVIRIPEIIRIDYEVFHSLVPSADNHTFLDGFCRIPSHHRPRFDILLCDHRARPHNRPFSHRYTGPNKGARRDPYLIFEDNRFGN